MVNEPRILVNSDFFTEKLDKLYKALRDGATEHRNRFFMACCGKEDSRDSYIGYGYYKRRATDARITGYSSSGIPEIEVTENDKFEIQRLQHKSCGHTHGLMLELFYTLSEIYGQVRAHPPVQILSFKADDRRILRYV